MITLLKTGYEKIIKLFYNEKNAKIHLREIARRSNINENSATRFLINLEKQQILQSQKEGNLKRYYIRKNNSVFIILALFDIERYSKLPSVRRNAIEKFLDLLEEKPIIVILFGSTAKESFTERSDIDLLLIVNKKIKTKEAEEYTESQNGLRINCLQITFASFLNELKVKNDKVIQAALNSGYPLTNHLLYYGGLLR